MQRRFPALALVAIALPLGFVRAGSASAKDLVRQWDKVYGGSGDDTFTDSLINPDGTILAVGRSTSHSPSTEDTFAMLFAVNGDVLWQRVYRYQDGTNTDEICGQVDRTSDGGYVIAGYLNPGPLGSKDGYLIRLDAAGSKLWEKTYGTAAAEDARAVAATPEGGCVTAGMSFGGPGAGNDVMVTKFAADGTITWQRFYTTVGFSGGLDSYEGATAIRALADGGYIVTGDTYSRASSNQPYASRAFLLRLDAAGNIVWQRADVIGHGADVVPSPDGGFVYTGTLNDAALGVQGGGDAMLVKTDALGAVQWLKRYGGPGYDAGLAMTTTSNGGYAVAGWYVATTKIGTQAENQWAFVTDASGTLLYEDINVRETASFDDAYAIHETSDGGFIVTGNIDGVPLPPGGPGLGGRDASLYKLRAVASPATVSGSVFHDLAANCALDGGDFGMNNATVSLTEITSGQRYLTVSGAGGLYTAKVPPGTYDVSLLDNARAKATCSPALTRRVSVGENQRIGGQDFFAQAAAGACAPSVSVIGTAPPNPNSCGAAPYAGCNGLPQTTPCVGYPWTYCVTVTNNGSAPWPANSILVNLIAGGGNRTVCGVDSMAATGSGSLTILNGIGPSGYVFTNPTPFAPGDSVTVCVTFMVTGSGPYSTVTSVNTACQTSAFDVLTETQMCSCDPNDMTVWPKGCGATGDIPPQRLTYRVRFENTGAGPAHDVVVRNPIDADLDVNTLQIVEASHPITSIQLDADNTLVVTFAGIELPAPDANAPQANKGFFRYTIEPKAALPNGTTIENAASIYFDNNPPVTTNTTINTIYNDGSVPSADFSVLDNGDGTYDFSYTGANTGAALSWYFGEGANPTTSTDRNPSGISMGDERIVVLLVDQGGCAVSAAKDLSSLPCDRFTTSDFLRPMGKRKKVGAMLPVKFDLTLDGTTPITSQAQLDQLLLDLGLDPVCPEILVYDVSAETYVALPDDPADESASDDSDNVDNPGLCFIYKSDDGDGGSGDSDSDSGDTGGGHWVFNLKLDPALFASGQTYEVKVRIGDCILSPGNNRFQTK